MLNLLSTGAILLFYISILLSHFPFCLQSECKKKIPTGMWKFEVDWIDRTRVFFYLVCEAIGTAATPGLFCQPRVIMKMIVEKQMECKLAGEPEVLGENLTQRHFCPSQNPT
jgi:hypothetical protein